MRQLRSAKFDPDGDPGDAARKREYDRDLEERGLDEAGVLEAEAHLRSRMRDEAEHDKGLTSPDTPMAASVFFVLALSLSFAPTLKDELYRTIPDQVLGWILAIVTGAMVSTAIVLPVMTAYVAHGRALGNWMGLGAAIGFGVANLLLRVSAATDRTHYLLAAGLTAWEIAAVVLLEVFARRYRTSHADWADQEMQKSLAAKRRAAAEGQLTQSRARVAAREARIKAFIAYVDARAVLHERPEDVLSAAKFAARQAYRRKVKDNLGVRVGADWRAN